MSNSLRGYAVLLRQALVLPKRDIANVAGLNTTILFGWAQLHVSVGEADMVSSKTVLSNLSD